MLAHLVRLCHSYFRLLRQLLLSPLLVVFRGVVYPGNCDNGDGGGATAWLEHGGHLLSTRCCCSYSRLVRLTCLFGLLLQVWLVSAHSFAFGSQGKMISSPVQSPPCASVWTRVGLAAMTTRTQHMSAQAAHAVQAAKYLRSLGPSTS